MIEFIIYILITSAWIWGVNCLFSEGHLLEATGDVLWEALPEWICKPLFNCPACMSSVHGLIWFFVGIPFCFNDTLPIGQLIPFLICLCGLNFLLIKFTSKERIIIEDE